MQNLHQIKEFPVCVLQKKRITSVCVGVCVGRGVFVCLFVFSPFSVSVEVERGGGSGGEVYNRPFQHLLK